MQPFDYIFIISGTLGCMGSLVVILTHFLLPSMRTQSRKLLVWLSLCDLGQGLFFAGFLGDRLQDPRVCLAHHLLGVFSAASSFWWTACIAVYVFFTLYNAPYHPFCQSSDRFTWMFHVISWGYPLALVLPYRFYQLRFEYPQAAGRDGWFPCIEPTQAKLFWEYEFPLMLCWSLTVLFYTLAVFQLRKMRAPPMSPYEVSQVRAIFVYVPIVFVLLRVGGLAALVMKFWFGGAPLWLMYVRAVGDPSQGFFNAIAFVAMTPTVRARLLLRLRGYPEDEMALAATNASNSLLKNHYQVSAFTTPPPSQYGALMSTQQL
eukprot:EG_transcript_13147